MEKNCKTCKHQYRSATDYPCNSCCHVSPGFNTNHYEPSHPVSQGYTTCTGIINANGRCSVYGQEAISTSYQCGRLIPINAASDITPDLCCGMYTTPAEKVERFEKVEVKTEDDLPKVAGSYIACLRNGSIYEDYKFIGIDNTFPDTNHWMRHIKWWLRPVK